ncbi:class I SAM-dependent methyltransferase [Candidatus Micrarchaeota archaeon]|nr:class I SAM-dependent methyltransferase [Candidatus Micrarchaeota archaeon]MBU2476622.1 class I SAM-dependent methyltransferase [Candidatus Micrarchaeota archaeon]
MSSIVAENYNSKAVVNLWPDFIDWSKRRQGENGFLKKTLEKNKVNSVFDSCLGDGCDSIYLLKEGFDVTSNDFDLEFIKKAQENARKENVKLNISSFDWRELGRHYDKESFDAVLCLGNSLTYLFCKKDQLNTLRQFYKILKKDGILVIDERNYQYFLDEKDEILKGNFRYSGKFVYCGKKVHAYPIKIEKNRVVMEYSDKNKKNKGNLVLYPFRRNEMKKLLAEAGFKKIQQFSDYKKEFNPDADFYIYVCRK